MSTKQEMQTDAKISKALAMLKRLKAKGLLSIDNPEIAINDLQSKYGENTYDIVLSCINRPYELMAALGQSGRTSAESIKYFISNNINQADLNKALAKDTPAPSSPKSPTNKIAEQTKAALKQQHNTTTHSAPQREVLQSPQRFNHVKDNSWFKTENIDWTALNAIKEVLQKKYPFMQFSANFLNNGKNMLAETMLKSLTQNHQGQQFFNLKDLQQKLNLSSKDLELVLGPDAIEKAKQNHVEVDLATALNLTERKILKDYEESKQQTMIYTNMNMRSH
ncbi:MAG: hypothetical protein IJ864_00195 [Alphaproteobacteria bacterium]|nr:hypothetical protein [Alphaproteobacteria bacterium]